jgi:hypothetical protein
MAMILGRVRNKPKFTAERSLYTSAAHYRSASATHACSAEPSVSPQLRRFTGGGLGNTSSCDGCDTFSYVGCLMDCGAPGTDCTRACLAKSLECDLCSVDLFHFGGRLVM